MSARSDEARKAFDDDRVAHWVAEGGLKRLLDEHETLENYRDAHGAGVVAEEPEWEYLIRRPNGSEFVSSFSEAGPGSRVVSKRQKCPWVPVEQEGMEDV